MSAILIDVLLFSCIAAFYTGIVIAAAVLLGPGWTLARIGRGGE